MTYIINADLSQFLDNGWYTEASLFYNGYIYWCEAQWHMEKEKKIHFFVYRFKAKNIDNLYYETTDTSEPFEFVLDILGNDIE